MIAKKLHLKSGMRVAVINAPDTFVLAAPDGVTVEGPRARKLDAIVYFTSSQKALSARWPKLLDAVDQAGAIWVAYPKKGSGIATDLASMLAWDVTKGSAWNTVSMISIDAQWTAVRFKYAPGLAEARDARPHDQIVDADGTVVVDRQTRTVTPPKDFARMLRTHAQARTNFAALAFSHQKEFVVWIVGAKKPETRTTRISKAVAMLEDGSKQPSNPK